MPPLLGETGMTHLRGFDEGFWHGLFEGAFHLVAVGAIASVAGIFYQRYRETLVERQQLIDALDHFTNALYRPRKLYQRLLARGDAPVGWVAERWREWRASQFEVLLTEFVGAVGQFRSLQIRVVALFGHDPLVFGYYLAIWRYLKEVRDRMERHESLLFHHEAPQSVDAFYRLIDSFRHQVAVGRVARPAHGQVRPAFPVLKELRRQGERVYAAIFEQPRAGESERDPPV